MKDPTGHPAYVAFMEAWNAPMDLSQGSRMGLEFHEMGVVHAAGIFAESDPPQEVVQALVDWLRPEFRLGGWNYAGQALRVILKSEDDARVRELGELVEDSRVEAGIVQDFLRTHSAAPIEIRDALRNHLWSEPERFGLSYDALKEFVNSGTWES